MFNLEFDIFSVNLLIDIFRDIWASEILPAFVSAALYGYRKTISTLSQNYNL